MKCHLSLDPVLSLQTDIFNDSGIKGDWQQIEDTDEEPSYVG